MRHDEPAAWPAQFLGAVLCATISGAPGMAAPSAADVTVTARTTTSAFGLSTEAETVTAIKGLRMRLDTTLRGRTLTSLIDLEQARFVSLDHANRQALLFDLRAYAARLRANAGGSTTGTPAPEAGARVSLVPTGRRQTLAGLECEEQKIEASIAVLGDEPPRQLEVRGTAWLAPEGQGRTDWAAFHRAVVERGLFFTDPRVAEVDPARATIIAAVYAGMGQGGMPCASHLEVTRVGAAGEPRVEGDQGRAVLETHVTHVATTVLADERFEIPAGYATAKR